MVRKIALVSDFDGTITPEDFFWYVSNQYLDKDSLLPWNEYLAGRETHLNALNRIFSHIHVPTEDFINFIKTIPYDEFFTQTAVLCRQKDIPFYICSAGCDYYINHIIGTEIHNEDINLITNHGVYHPKSGLVMQAQPKDSPYYDVNVGISKSAVVKKLKEDGYFVIFAGDGPPDKEPAKQADKVFAKKILLEYCIRSQKEYTELNNFSDIYNYLQEI